MPPTHLRDVLIAELSDALGADRQLLDAWPVLGDAASAQTLKRFCAEGVDYTQDRIRRLATAFSILKVDAVAKPSTAIGCLIKDALDIAGVGNAGPVRDAAILAAIQKLSHYGHASYGSIVGFAETLQEDGVAKLLDESLDEKGDAIEEMTDMAADEINPRAARADA
jgi:ferritin-like metal-binding protein YciE